MTSPLDTTSSTASTSTSDEQTPLSGTSCLSVVDPKTSPIERNTTRDIPSVARDKSTPIRHTPPATRPVPATMQQATPVRSWRRTAAMNRNANETPGRMMLVANMASKDHVRLTPMTMQDGEMLVAADRRDLARAAAVDVV